ncbi:MAG: metallophosphoesterase [Clostridia bacterium]|nr:metallophosphoesterase [Clostridia bacterium]
MLNIKKLIALVLSVSLAFGVMATSVSAEETNEVSPATAENVTVEDLTPSFNELVNSISDLAKDDEAVQTALTAVINSLESGAPLAEIDQAIEELKTAAAESGIEYLPEFVSDLEKAIDDMHGPVVPPTTAPETEESEGTAERPAAAPFRISVAVNGDPTSQKGITWYTAANTKSIVDISDENGNKVNATISYEDVFEFEGNYVHKALVTGLEAGKTYYYDVGDETVRSAAGKFVTDNADSKFNFITVADIQASSLENFQAGAKVLDAAFDTMSDAEFMINLGDFTNDSTNEEWDFYDEALKTINLGTTIVPVAGNHDGLGVWDWFNNMFCLDTSESVQNLNGVNYSFDYGNAHFAVLNTNDLLAVSLSQLQWLKNDMNSTDKDWKIVLMHKSPYTLGKDGKWPDALYLQSSLTKTLAMCDVDLVMSGHDHQYLRTKPLTNNKLDDDGTTYVLAGTAGTKRYEVRSFLANHYLKTDFIAAMTIQKDGYGNYWNGENWDNTKQTNIGGCFNTISVDGGKLTFNSYILADEANESGEQVVTNIDSFTLEKETGKNKATFSGDNTTSEFEYYLGVVPSFLCLAAYAFGNWLPKFFIMLPELLSVVINDGTF